MLPLHPLSAYLSINLSSKVISCFFKISSGIAYTAKFACIYGGGKFSMQGCSAATKLSVWSVTKVSELALTPNGACQ